MAEYELVREIPNLCKRNQMRDVFFEEVECDDPETYVREMLTGQSLEISTDRRADGSVTVFAICDGMTQKYIFTPL